MISKEQITAVIPTHNRLYELDRCINSIYPYVKEIIVIDNDSYESISALEKKYENVHVFSYPNNLGPCKAQNIGVSLAETPYVLLLDNDTELVHWCNLPLDMDNDEAVQAFRIEGDKFFHMYSNSPEHPGWVQQIPWFYGCACLINKKLWEEVGGYNEDYFAYYQECDISAKFWKKSYYISYNPSLVFAHRDSPIHRDRRKMSFWRARNLMWFCFEHLPLGTGLFQITKMFIAHPIMASKGYIAALKNLPKRDPITDGFFLKVWRK